LSAKQSVVEQKPKHTARLRFERLSVAHLDDLFRLHSDQEVMRFIRAPDAAIAETKATLDTLLAAFEKTPTLGVFPAYCAGEFVGWGVLAHLERDPRLEVEVGYRLHVRHWGKGYATEIARELVRYGFEDLGLSRIVAITRPDHVRSQHVIDKLGFRYEGDRVYYQTEVRYYARNAAGAGASKN
jgi:RimJ/RimL family protein N-acetyltransferase